MMHNFIAYFRKGGDLLKSYWAKWPCKQVVFFHGRTVKRAEFNIFTCKPRSIFKTLRLIRLSRILSYANHKNGKFQWFHVQTSCVKIQLTVRACTHHPGKQYAWTMCYLLHVLFLARFIRRAAWQAWLLAKLPPGISASQYWDSI